MSAPDPRAVVDAPIRRALWRVVAGGVALAGTMGVLAAVPLAWDLDVDTDDAIAKIAPVLLLGYAAVVQLSRRLQGAASESALADAWDRARLVDPDDALLGRIIAAWVPIGLLMALGALIWPHLTDRNPALAAAWSVLGVPPFVVAWLVASSTWLASCREGLARAEGESDALFRTYWANVGH